MMNAFAIVLIFLAALFSFFSFVGAVWITGKLIELEKKYRQDQAIIREVLLDINKLERLNNQDQKEFLALAREVLEDSMNK